MARKTLLTESEIRRFMKLASMPAIGAGRVRTRSEQVPGEEDPMAGHLAMMLRTGKFVARSFLVREAPQCGHRFDGEENTKLLTQAFHWAFEGDNSQPINK